jgi:hypothetical protein
VPEAVRGLVLSLVAVSGLALVGGNRKLTGAGPTPRPTSPAVTAQHPPTTIPATTIPTTTTPTTVPRPTTTPDAQCRTAGDRRRQVGYFDPDS